jgi:hypothetical protein
VGNFITVNGQTLLSIAVKKRVARTISLSIPRFLSQHENHSPLFGGARRRKWVQTSDTKHEHWRQHQAHQQTDWVDE